MKKVLFIYDNLSEFIKRDIDILSQNYSVITHRYAGIRDVPILAKKIFKTNLNISRFALSHATMAVFLSKLLLRKSIVVVSGWDVATIPEIGYGAMLNPKRVWKTKFTLKNADFVTAESGSLKQDALKYVKRDVKVIYQGFDSYKFSPSQHKEDMVLTVAGVTRQNFLRKGLEPFVKAARNLPDVQFVLVGKFIDDSINELRSLASSNVKFTGFIPEDELTDYYRKAKVYVQVSLHEGFGCSLAEAMLCECVPVVTDKGAIPEVVGDTGFYVPQQDITAISDAIGKALSSNKGRNARSRIVNTFPVERRREGFRTVIDQLLGV